MLAAPWLRIGWRNLGRNRRRTGITMAGLAFGYLAVVLLIGWTDGITADMIESGTRTVAGQIQIHDVAYRPERKIYLTIGGREGTDVDELVRAVLSDPAIEAATPRVYAGGLVSSGEATAAGILMGIDPARERQVSRISQAIARGRAPSSGANEIAIGAEMAKQLAVDVGAEIILVVPAADGSMGNDLYTVTGVFETGLTGLDASYALLPLASLQRLTALEPSRVHEIAASVTDPWVAPDAASRIAERLAPMNLEIEVEPWTRLRPEMLDYAQLARSWYGVVIAIVFSIAIFGVANTMLMATYERLREFAVLLALGASPFAIVRSVLAEAVSLGAISLAVGVVITLPIIFWLHAAPLDLSFLYGDYTFFGALIRPRLRVELNPTMWVWSGIALVVTAILASLYPAMRAARVPPADTLSGL